MSFTVDVSQIHNTSGEMNRNAAELEHALARVVGSVQTLAGSWTGAAANELQGAFAEWQSIQTRVREQLALMAQLTARAGQTYQQTEDSVRGMFAR
ncbi:MAG: WXG100 family type VII secretion target [Actinomycetales bacterium]|nr:WXG100 family type VII secretion target [Actinomycetales bacterium]